MLIQLTRNIVIAKTTIFFLFWKDFYVSLMKEIKYYMNIRV